MISVLENFSWGEIIDSLILDLKQTFVAPASNPTITFLVILILLVLLAILTVLGISAYLFFTRDKKTVSWIQVPPTRRDIWISLSLFLLFIAALGISATYYTQHESSCLNCHTAGLEKRALEESPHKELTCVACHMRPGVTGYVQQKVDFARWVHVYLTTEEAPRDDTLQGNVADSSCLKCHRDVLDDTITKYNLRISHKEIYEGASRCVDCHNQVAHPGVSTPERVASMMTCLICHDGQEAASECSTCHTRDIGEGVRPVERDFPQISMVDLEWNWCYDCHDEDKECLPCHGVTMPHPPGWDDPTLPTHARDSAFTEKEVCWRCHYSNRGPFTKNEEFCMECHQIEFHGPDEYTYWSHQQFDSPECTGLCHTPKTCEELCHSRREPRDLPAPYKDYPFLVPDY